jgi:DNA-directed RNA polymerase subunit L
MMMMDIDDDDGISITKSFRDANDVETIGNTDDEQTNHCLLVMKGVPVSMANAMRRTVLCNIPVLAIDEKDIKIKTNTGPLHCEYVSHRLSLTPISFQRLVEPQVGGGNGENDYGPPQEDKDDYGPPQEDDYGPNAAVAVAVAAAAAPAADARAYSVPVGEYKIQERFTFAFSVKNDAPTTAVMEVTTDNVRVFDMGKDVTAKMLPVIFKDKYLITKLKPKEMIECEFKLSLGTATQHARYQAVNTISYRYLVPADIRQLQTPSIMTYDKISLSEEQQGASAGAGAGPEGFIFYIEKGVLALTTVCQQALEIIKGKILAFFKFVEKNKIANKAWWRAEEQLVEFEYPNETHTVGNLIATYGLLLFPEAFIGYRITHPLENKILLRFKFAAPATPDQHFENIQRICDKIILDCQKLQTFF